MSYEGTEEYICNLGHFWELNTVDASTGDIPKCPNCQHHAKYHCSVDHTNGYDSNNPRTYSGEKTQIGWSEIPEKDHRGNRYFRRVEVYRPNTKQVVGVVKGSRWSLIEQEGKPWTSEHDLYIENVMGFPVIIRRTCYGHLAGYLIANKQLLEAIDLDFADTERNISYDETEVMKRGDQSIDMRIVGFHCGEHFDHSPYIAFIYEENDPRNKLLVEGYKTVDYVRGQLYQLAKYITQQSKRYGRYSEKEWNAVMEVEQSFVVDIAHNHFDKPQPL